MKKINIILIIVNILLLVLVIVKLSDQNVNIEYKISDSDMTFKDIKKELINEIIYGENKYSEFTDGKWINTSEEMKKEIVLDDGLIVKDFGITCENDFSFINADIKNSTSKILGGYYGELIAYNGLEEETFRLRVYIPKVEPNQNDYLAAGIMDNVTNMYRFEIKKIEEEN